MRATEMKPCRAAIAATLLALACGTEPPSNLTGTWAGTVDQEATNVEITLKDEDGALSGSVVIGNDDFSISGTVSGTYADPDVTINIRAVFDDGDTLSTESYRGKRVGEDRIEGHIDDPEEPVMLNLVRGG